MPGTRIAYSSLILKKKTKKKRAMEEIDVHVLRSRSSNLLFKRFHVPLAKTLIGYCKLYGVTDYLND